MSQKYKPKPPSGREYVDCAVSLASYTIGRCMKLPIEWKDYLLAPLAEDASDIEKMTKVANRVYINEKNMGAAALIKAYSERDSYLHEALRLFDDFDKKYERLMEHVDLAGSEIYRLKNEMLSLIYSLREEHPELKEVKIRLVAHKDSMEYRAANGSIYESLRLTPKNCDHWMFLRAEAEKEILKRLEADKASLRRLQKQVSKNL